MVLLLSPQTTVAGLVMVTLFAVDLISYNQFTFFLLANLSTGLVNFTVDTMAAGPSLSLAIVIGHMFILCLVMTVLHRYRVKLV